MIKDIKREKYRNATLISILQKKKLFESGQIEKKMPIGNAFQEMWIVSLRFENAERGEEEKERDSRKREKEKKEGRERDVKNTVKGRGLNFRGYVGQD